MQKYLVKADESRTFGKNLKRSLKICTSDLDQVFDFMLAYGYARARERAVRE